MKKELTKKIISTLLLAIMLLTFMSSCEKKDPSVGGNTTGEETTADVNLLPEPVLIGDDGESDYKLIRPEGMPQNLLSVCTGFYKEIRSDSAFSIKFGDDYHREGDGTSEAFEILFGAVDRAESIEVYDEINYDGYAVKNVGNKIVIAAYTEESLKKASELFFTECIKLEDGGAKVSFVKNVIEKGTKEKFFGKDNKLEDYTIVYGKNSLKVAENLKEVIRINCGFKLEILPHTAAETEKEILIGDTGREESDNTLPETSLGFIFKPVGTKIVINSAENIFLESCIPYIEREFLKNTHVMNFAKDTVVDMIAYSGTDRTALTADADIRIMSFNILSEEWTDEAVLEPRILGVVGTIMAYQPDVIGVQEVSARWYKVLKEYLTDYVFINDNKPSGTNQNYTALAYNKNKVKLLESDFTIYSVYNSKRLRSINFGLFETLDTGKKFAATNTHFNANHGGDNTPQRVTQAKEFVAKIQSYVRTYKVPIFMCGDYNSNDSSEPYKVIANSGFISEAKLTAKTKGKICLTYHNLGSAPGSASSSIDHIFYTGSTTPLYYTTLTDDVLNKSSDHCPIFADFTLD